MSETTLIVGCGYLGRRVATRLVARGERVIGTTRDLAKAAALRDLGIEPWMLDVTSGEPIELPDADRLLYCVGFDRRASHSFREVYVDGLVRVLEALAPRVPRIVYAGSTGVYGQTDGRWVDEDTPPEPRGPDAEANLEAEARLRRLAPTAVVLRFAGLYGPGRIIRRATVEAGSPIPADPDGYLNLIHIDDAAAAAVAALDVTEPDALYLIADDAPSPRRIFYETLARLLDAPRPTFVPLERPDEPSKRVRNDRMKRGLGVRLAYPGHEAGLRASLAADQPSAGSM